MLYYIGDEIHLSIVKSFRIEKLESQQSKPKPVFKFSQAALIPTPTFSVARLYYVFLSPVRQF